MEVTLVEIGSLDLAKEAVVALIQSGYPWVVAATEVEMVRQEHAEVGTLLYLLIRMMNSLKRWHLLRG